MKDTVFEINVANEIGPAVHRIVRILKKYLIDHYDIIVYPNYNLSTIVALELTFAINRSHKFGNVLYALNYDPHWRVRDLRFGTLMIAYIGPAALAKINKLAQFAKLSDRYVTFDRIQLSDYE